MAVLVDSNVLIFSIQQGYPWQEESIKAIEAILAADEPVCVFLHDTPAVYSQWRKLVLQHDVKGIQAHDARIAAGMQIPGVTRLLTCNPRDFSRYDGIAAIRPNEVK